MKRCPKCNRTFTTDTQKFCTHDGGVLEGMAPISETVRLDPNSAVDESTKVLSEDLPSEETADFDPFKTVVSQPAKTVVDEQFDPFKTVMSRPETVTENIRDTRGTSSPLMRPEPLADPPRVAEPEPEPSRPAVPPPPVIPTPPTPPVPPSTSPTQVQAPADSPRQQPTQRLVGSSPMASAPLPQLTVQPAPQAAVPAPPKKKSRLPLVLGILALLFIIGGGVVGALYWFVARPMLAKRDSSIEKPQEPAKPTTLVAETTPNEPPAKPEKTQAPEPRAYAPPADAVQFVNSKETLDGKLAEHYVEFSFYYPNRWQKDASAGVPGARNFAQVERRLPPDFTQENFAVAWNSSAAPVAENLALFHNLADNLSKQFQSKFPGYHKISEGETKAGAYDGYEFRFEGLSKDTAKGDVKLWGRVIFLPPQDGGKDGVTLLMLATSLAPELRSVDDVGVKGELPMMLESFRFGKK
jgi:hypothetical protein